MALWAESMETGRLQTVLLVVGLREWVMKMTDRGFGTFCRYQGCYFEEVLGGDLRPFDRMIQEMLWGFELLE
jgi:hypothetical protein